MKLTDDIEDISNDITGYFSDNPDSMGELLSWTQKFSKKFGLNKLSRKFWGSRKSKQVQQIVYDSIEKQADGRVATKKTKFQLMDDLQKDVKSKHHQKSDFARVARTATADTKVIFQLLSWQKAGVIRVKHNNNKGSVARKTVGKRDKAYHGRIFIIAYLLSKAGAKDRITLHPNCMCYYTIEL